MVLYLNALTTLRVRTYSTCMHIAHRKTVVKIVCLYNSKDSINSRHSRNGKHAKTIGIQQQQAFSNSKLPSTADTQGTASMLKQ